MELTIEQALQLAVTPHKEGKLQDAERLYRSILQSQTLQPDANHNLGLLAVSANKAGAPFRAMKSNGLSQLTLRNPSSSRPHFR